MKKTEKNRQLILAFFQQISGTQKTKLSLKPYTSDPKLIDHLLFWEQLFPKYHLRIDEVSTEEERVIVLGHTHGTHTGAINGFAPTRETLEIPFAAGYRIAHGKITEHWFIADHLELLEKMGLVKVKGGGSREQGEKDFNSYESAGKK